MLVRVPHDPHRGQKIPVAVDLEHQFGVLCRAALDRSRLGRHEDDRDFQIRTLNYELIGGRLAQIISSGRKHRVLDVEVAGHFRDGFHLRQGRHGKQAHGQKGKGQSSEAFAAHRLSSPEVKVEALYQALNIILRRALRAVNFARGWKTGSPFSSRKGAVDIGRRLL
jgi:hypothetical protein